MTNRATIDVGDQVRGPSSLPPSEPEGRLRVLVVTGYALGWRTYSASVASTTARRDDIDAVHVRAAPSKTMALAGAPVPGTNRGGWWDPHLRRTRAAQIVHGRWLRRNIDLSRFDLVHVTPQFTAASVISLHGRPPTTLGIDATATQAKAQRNDIAEDVARTRFAPLIALERRVFDAVDSIVCMSTWAANALPAAIAAKAVVVPPSVDVPEPELRPRATDEPVRLLFVGNDWERKGGPRLLHWHQEHLTGRAELHVCSATAPVDAGARDVVWHGPTDRDMLLRELMPAMDALVLPTRSDMSPWAIVEAVASGLPIISSDIGGIGELVVHGGTGLLIDPHDDHGFVGALVDFVSDQEARLRLRTAALEHALTTVDHRGLGDRLVEHWYEVASHR